MNEVTQPATVSDIRFCYLIILGREPENESALQAFANIGLKPSVEEFAASEEFGIVRSHFFATDALPHEKLGNAGIRKCSDWLSGLYRETGRQVWHDWPSLLYGLLTAPALALTHSYINDKFIEELRGQGSGPVGFASAALSDTEFDRAWFVRSHPSISMLTYGDQKTSDEDLVRYGLTRGLQILPMFSTGCNEPLGFVLKDPAATTEAIHLALQGLLDDGALGHWLFADSYYDNAVRTYSTGRRTPSRSAKLNYTHYLLKGAFDGYGPHPLFSTFAYHRYNGIARENAYRHYLTRGCGQSLATSAVFDADYYMTWNPDARSSVQSGRHRSALHHFLDVGIPANYRFSPDFDIDYYASSYPDVAEAVENGLAVSITWHFVMIGLPGGRRPNPHFDPAYYRTRHPHVVQDMKRLKIDSELEHFLLIGRYKSYRAEPPVEARHPALDEAKLVMNRRSLRSYDTVRRSPLDFSAFATGNIGVSIVVPVMNDVEFTCNFLRCAYFAAGFLAQQLGLGTQVIIVSNGSSDDTVAVVEACRGVLLVAHDAPIGFPKAVNAGARRATGEVLIVANNDIQFEPDTFVRIVERLRASPEVGIVGGLIILPNETLQEAGSFLNSLGGVAGLGRTDRPWDPYYRGLHPADYCTGCFISMARGDYEALGGLDESFSPGYYEETDLSFRLRKVLGKSSYVDSNIQIVHYEHATFGKGRPIMTAYAKIKHNQALFVEKHAGAVKALPSPGDLADAGYVRPKAVARTRMLVVDDLIPDARLGSGFGRTAQILSTLSDEGVAFDILVLAAHAVVDEYVDRRVRVYRQWMPQESLEHVLSCEGAKYSHVVVCRLHNLARFADALERARTAHGLSVICDTEALSPLRDIQIRRSLGIPLTDRDEAITLRNALSPSVKVAAWLCVNDLETRKLAQLGYDNVLKIPFRFERSSSGGASGRSRILSVGSIHEIDSPNHEAISWFMEQVHAKCGTVWHTHRLTLVGYWDERLLRDFRDRHAGVEIDYLGVLREDELDVVYRDARLAIAPTRIAAGVATKVVEAMAKGVPIVMSDILAGQLDGYAQNLFTDLAVGRRDDDGAAFAGWIVRLCGDDEIWDRVRAEQFEIWQANFSPDVFDRCMREMMEFADITRPSRTGAGAGSPGAVHARLRGEPGAARG